MCEIPSNRLIFVEQFNWHFFGKRVAECFRNVKISEVDLWCMRAFMLMCAYVGGIVTGVNVFVCVCVRDVRGGRC